MSHTDEDNQIIHKLIELKSNQILCKLYLTVSNTTSGGKAKCCKTIDKVYLKNRLRGCSLCEMKSLDYHTLVSIVWSSIHKNTLILCFS